MLVEKALITGITGQDGSYLAELLLEKGYEVHGLVRRASISNTIRIDHLLRARSIMLHDGDLYRPLVRRFLKGSVVFHPIDVNNLLNNPTKAKNTQGWNPQKTSYEELCAIMAENDLRLEELKAQIAIS